MVMRPPLADPTSIPDREVAQVARDLLRRAERSAGSRWRSGGRRSTPGSSPGPRASPAFKTNLFRFVDVFPACVDADDVARHLVEYLDDPSSPAVVRRGLGPVRRGLPGARRLASASARRGIERMAARFIVGATIEQVVVAKLARVGRGASPRRVDFLGEKTVTAADADAYAAQGARRCRRLGEAARGWPERPLLERDPWGQLGRANVSIKPTALSPHLVATSIDLGVEEAIDRLVPVLAAATRHGVTLNFDSEHDETQGRGLHARTYDRRRAGRTGRTSAAWCRHTDAMRRRTSRR